MNTSQFMDKQILGLTVAVPGLVDGQGVVRVAPNLGWLDTDVSGDLAKALRDPGFPIQADNDANLGALAEHGRRPRPADRERTQHQQLGAERENAPFLMPVGRVPGPEEVADPRHHEGGGPGVTDDHGTSVPLLPVDRGPADRRLAPAGRVTIRG
jgi:hypothetical protein